MKGQGQVSGSMSCRPCWGCRLTGLGHSSWPVISMPDTETGDDRRARVICNDGMGVHGWGGVVNEDTDTTKGYDKGSIRECTVRPEISFSGNEGK